MFDHIFFDFDGTIMDTSPGIYDSFDRVIAHYNLDYPRSEYDRMIGPPLRESFGNILNLPESEIRNAIKVYRDYYSTEGMYNARLYDGVVELIENLRKSGKKIYTATSKPELFTRRILEKYELDHLFDFIGGSDLEERGRVEKKDVVEYVVNTRKLSDNKEKCILIGDRKYDVVGAHEAGIKCAGILWGFGSREEFESCGADFILETPSDVETFLLQE